MNVIRILKDELGKKVAEKQAAYSRLYFLSDSQILSLMKSLKPGTEVLISSIFPGVDRLVLDGMMLKSVFRDNQVLPLLRAVNMSEGPGFRSLEDWLSELEQVLKNTQAARIMQQVHQNNTEIWKLSGDREVLYIAYLVWFTTQVNAALRSEDGKTLISGLISNLKIGLEICLKSLRPKGGVPGRPAAGLVYSMFGVKKKSLERANELMVCILLHHLDWLSTVESTDLMDWEVLWRPCFKLTATATGNEVKECLAVTVSCMDFETNYGFEMHPMESTALFIYTPASCQSLLHAYLTIKHGLSVLLSGDSGTGKTETLTHLSVLCGRFLHTSYSATMIPFEITMKSLIGCALGGYWVCFDDVQSLPLMYLSTLAHYIRTIQAAFEPDPVRVTIEGITMRPKVGFSVFATTAVACPAPFRDLFRCVSVPRPDLRLMCDVLLQTFGLERKYSANICRALEILAEEPVLSADSRFIALNTQAGIRTLMRIIKAMLGLCQRFPLPDMSYLINNAFRKIYGLGLLPRELLVLDELLATLFSSRHNDILSLSSLKTTGDAVTEVLIDPKLVCQETMQRRCQHFLALLGCSRPWIFVVGGPLTGKTLVITEVAKATGYLDKRKFMIHRLGLGVTPEQFAQLFDYLSLCSEQISLAAPKIRFHSTPTSGNTQKFSEYDWIVLDSPSFSYNLVPALRKSHPSSRVRLLVESENLAGVSPDMVSEAGILYLEDQDMDLFSFYQVALTQVMSQDLMLHLQSLLDMYHSILQPALTHINSTQHTLRISNKVVISLFAKLLKPYLDMINKHLHRQEGTSAIPLKNAPLVLLKRSKTLTRHVKTNPKPADRESNVATTLMSYLGSVRKQFKQLEPQLCLEAVYISAVATALGNLVGDAWGLHKVIKDVLATKNQEYAYFLYNALEEMPQLSLLDLRFSLKEMKWLPALEGVEEVQGPTYLGPSVFEIAGAGLTNLESHRNLETVLIPTPGMLRLRYWTNFCLRNHVDVVVFGPHQCGKSSIVMSVAKDLLKKNFSGLVALNLSEYTSYPAIQASIQGSMENIKPQAYGGLGGTYYYAVLDDMNMDAPKRLYDLFRFWKDTGGWYSEGFTTVSNLTVALVHSYSEGHSRAMWERALRHFVVLHKSNYTTSEVEVIFTTFITAASGSHLTQLASTAPAVFMQLYTDLAHRETEELWCNSSLSNFCGALQFLAHFQQFDDIDEKLFTELLGFTCDRFFLQQYPPTDIQHTITSQLSQILTQPIAGLLLPNDEQEMWELTPDRVTSLVSSFQASYQQCIVLYPQYLKNLHSLFFDAERRLGSFYYFYINTIFDIESSCQSVIVRADAQLFIAKALLFIAANSLQVQLFDMNIPDRENLSSSIQEAFYGISPLHLSTELKFQLRKLLEAAMVHNKRVIVVFTLFDSQQLDLPVGRRLMEIANDIISGVKLRLTGFSDVYKKVLDDYQEAHPEVSQGMFNDEMLQMLLDRMRQNVTIFFLVSSKDEAWVRSPLHSIGLFEKFKHRYRQLFNKSRVIDFDHLSPPEALVQSLKPWVPEWQLHYHNSLLQQLGAVVQDLNCGLMEEFAYETLIHCSQLLQRSYQSHSQDRASKLTTACSKITLLDSILDQTSALLQEFSAVIHSKEHILTTLKSDFKEMEEKYATEIGENYELALENALEKRENEVNSTVLSRKQAWEAALQLQPTSEDLKDAEKVNPSILLSLYRLIFGETRETDEVALKKCILNLTKRTRDFFSRLRHLTEGNILGSLSILQEVEQLSPGRVKLDRDLRRLLEVTAVFALALSKSQSDLQEIASNRSEIPKLVQERLKRLNEEKNARLKDIKKQIEVVESELKEAMRQHSQILQSKPVVTRLDSDLKLAAEDWSDQLAQQSEEVDFGNSLLASVMLLKGLHCEYSTRERLFIRLKDVLKRNEIRYSEVSLAELLQGNSQLFKVECSMQGVPEAKLMYDNIAALKAIQMLGLPTPIILDPYDIAQDYITSVEEGKDLLIGTVMNEPGFEPSLKNCISAGKPVLCIDPSASLMKVLLPVLKWQSHSFVAKMRGLEVRPLQMLGKVPAIVHPDFRLYICVKVPPSTEILDLATWVNFDASDQESWSAFTSLPLLKLLDPAQHDAHLAQRSKSYHQVKTVFTAEKELLDLLINQDLKLLLTSEELLDAVVRIWKKLKNLPAEDEVPKKRRGSIFFIKTEYRLPREKLKTILEELYVLKRTMETCAPLLKDYAVPAKVLHAMIECACAEYIKYIAVPLESQWDAFAECLTYRVFIRISHALSNEKRQIFMSFFVIYKYFQTTEDKTQFLKIINDIYQSSDSALSQSERELFLITNYSGLFSPSFKPGSPSYQSFLTKPLYSDAKAPGTLSPLQKYLLYAYLRPDLLPAFVRHLGEEVLGHRYSWVPKTDYSIYTGDVVKLPTIIFYASSSPVLYLQHLAESKHITLVRTKPVYVTNLRNLAGTRSIGKYVDSIINVLTDNLVSSRWITIENIDAVAGLEAEVLTKFLLYYIPQHVTESKKIWVVLQGTPDQYPQWISLVKHCQRIIMLEPDLLKEHMLLWHYTHSSEFFHHYRSSITQQYYAHCSLEGQAPQLPFQLKDKTRVTGGKELNEKQQRLRYQFNVSLLMSLIYLRSAHQSDLQSLWELRDAIQISREYDTLDVSNGSEFNLFCKLMGPNLSPFAMETFKDLTRMCFSGQTSLDFQAVSYPLYRLETGVEHVNLETLINTLPDEDNLLVTGLHPTVSRERKIHEANVFLLLTKQLHSSLKGNYDVLDFDQFRATEKSLLAENLKRFLNDLYKLPEPESILMANSEFRFKNVYLSREGGKGASWLQFVKDGFLIEDKRNSILTDFPSLSDVRTAVNTAEKHASNSFLRLIRDHLHNLYKFLSYRRSAISQEDKCILLQLTKDEVPAEWKERSLYVARRMQSAENWHKTVLSKYALVQSVQVLDLSMLFQPGLALSTVLRIAAMKAGERVEKFGFEVVLQSEQETDLKVSGLFLHRAEMNTTSGSLEESEEGMALPALALRPYKTPKQFRRLYPEGHLLVVQAVGEDTSLLEFVYCPLSFTLSPYWVLFPSKQTQGYWSRKGIQVDLHVR